MNCILSGNLLSGADLREAGAGNLITALQHSGISGNGATGAIVREADAGDLAATIENSSLTQNGGWGADARQAGTGTGLLMLTAVLFDLNASGAYAVTPADMPVVANP